MSFISKQNTMLVMIAVSILSGCVSPTHKLSTQSETVILRLDQDLTMSDCRWKGEVTGSEGHWYNSLFFTNSAMVRGAMNDIKNNATAIDANTVLLLSPVDFQTSVTLFGTAYHCQKIKLESEL
ncbi:hypothetical protein BCU70_17205 [Vibrio sp. 10N.286.49.C2]|uniref:DUF4156 domain-containing protein n=1 Tax=unclassified Vibrio TaxID=2614977 RepID=UPI000C829AD0|nr:MULTISPECIES: DUF4156 domain-containing protein [unclassified Vibrio]PMH36811.1 hypothetical protein BCU70_17205 [Vibrio sp. 10N.286.49.C2]PMH46974.1 hypothetical protein BCU66_22310 [Vibrio sp. 10N.286.49.B1]PMH82628.1 hypothetical protein BCU58_17545 [Vibrio sp. 10N.286.48.B7]